MENMVRLLPLLGLIAIQDILVGIFGAPSIVATMIASRAMGPRRSIILSAFAQLAGPFLFGVAVASTIGSEIVNSYDVTPPMLYAALISTIFWMIFTWITKIPSSSTHALLGAMIGAIFIAQGPNSIQILGLLKMLVSLTLTAPLALLVGYLFTKISTSIARDETPQTNNRFNQGQWVASLFLGLAIGSNNAQNAMGITALGLMATGVTPEFGVPLWVIIISAACLAIGNLIGGTRLIRSVGTQFCNIRPVHGFCAEVSSASIILVSALVGGGVSATHITNMSIVGAGAAESLRDIQWKFVRKVLVTWIVTMPFTGVLAALLYVAMQKLTISF
jgi:PiT family inorganic phosphate transporter